MTKFIQGKWFGDQGSISQALAEELWEQGVPWVTSLRCNLKPVVVLSDFDKRGLRKRSIIETIHDPRKHISPLQPSRHRSLTGFMLHRVAA